MISAENYKLKKDFSFKVLALVCVLFFIALSGIMKAVASMDLEADIGLSFQGINSLFTINAFYQTFTVCLAVFCGTNVVAEFDKGIIKNALSVGTKKSVYYFSKLYSLIVLSITIIIISAVVLFGTNSLLQGVGTIETSNFIFKSLMYFLVYFINLISYGAFFLMISFLLRGVGGTISICVVYVFLESSITQLLRVLNNDVVTVIANHLPHSIISGMMLETDWTAGKFFSSIYGAVIVIIVTTIIGLVNFMKRDIK